MYDMTPYRPAPVSTSATSANAETSTEFSRRGAIESPITSSIVQTIPTGSWGSTDDTADRTIDVFAAASFDERMTMAIVRSNPAPRFENS